MLRSIGLLVLALLAYQVESLSVSGNSVGPLGSTITLYCTPDPQDRNVNWLTPDGKVHNNPTPGRTFGIRIASLEEKKLGKYTCRANGNNSMVTIYVRLPEGDQDAISTTKRPIVSADVRTTKLQEGEEDKTEVTTKTYIIYPGNGSKSQQVSSVLIGSVILVAHMKVFIACLNSMLD